MASFPRSGVETPLVTLQRQATPERRRLNSLAEAWELLKDKPA